jgi:hypothetical protein
MCHGPWTLLEADAVSRRTLTSFPSIRTDLCNAGATVVEQAVVPMATSSPVDPRTTCPRFVPRSCRQSPAPVLLPAMPADIACGQDGSGGRRRSGARAGAAAATSTGGRRWFGWGIAVAVAGAHHQPQPGQVIDDTRVAARLAELGHLVDVEMRPAPDGKGSELKNKQDGCVRAVFRPTGATSTPSSIGHTQSLRQPAGRGDGTWPMDCQNPVERCEHMAHG